VFGSVVETTEQGPSNSHDMMIQVFGTMAPPQESGTFQVKKNKELASSISTVYIVLVHESDQSLSHFCYIYHILFRCVSLNFIPNWVSGSFKIPMCPGTLGRAGVVRASCIPIGTQKNSGFFHIDYGTLHRTYPGPIFSSRVTGHQVTGVGITGGLPLCGWCSVQAILEVLMCACGLSCGNWPGN